jgi:hypothetical protein
MKPSFSVVLMLLGAFLLALGFNTIDCMVNNFYWNGDYWRSINGWIMIPSIIWNWWFCYILFGILPLLFGGIILGMSAMKYYSLLEAKA